MIDDRVFVGIYGTRNCINCCRPFSEHVPAQGYHCPRFTVPPSVAALWASFGTRTPSAHLDGCPCAQCSHS